MTEVEQQPQTNGIETTEEDNKVRPADIEAVSAIDLIHINHSFLLLFGKTMSNFDRLLMVCFSFCLLLGHARNGSTQACRSHYVVAPIS